MRYLWESGIYRGPSQGQKSFKQFARKLSTFVQELSRQTAPEEVFMHCLRSACEGSPSMYQALASMETEQHKRMGYTVHCEDQREAADSTDNALIVQNDQGGAQMDITDGTAMTLRHQSHGHEPVILEEREISDQLSRAVG